MSPSWHPGKCCTNSLMVCKARASEIGWCPGGVHAFHRDAELAHGGGKGDGLGSGGQSLAVDNHNLGQRPLAGDQNLAPLGLVGETAAPAAELCGPHGGPHGDNRHLLVRQVRHDDLVRRFEAHLVVVEVAPFGQHHGYALAGVAGAAAAHCHQHIGFQFPGGSDRLCQHLHGGVGRYTRKQAGGPGSQGFLRPLHHVGVGQDIGPADHHRPAGPQPVDHGAKLGDGVNRADYLLARPGIVVIQGFCRHFGNLRLGSRKVWRAGW